MKNRSKHSISVSQAEYNSVQIEQVVNVNCWLSGRNKWRWLNVYKVTIEVETEEVRQ
jgi:hypothetical protein